MNFYMISGIKLVVQKLERTHEKDAWCYGTRVQKKNYKQVWERGAENCSCGIDTDRDSEINELTFDSSLDSLFRLQMKT